METAGSFCFLVCEDGKAGELSKLVMTKEAKKNAAIGEIAIS